MKASTFFNYKNESALRCCSLRSLSIFQYIFRSQTVHLLIRNKLLTLKSSTGKYHSFFLCEFSNDNFRAVHRIESASRIIRNSIRYLFIDLWWENTINLCFH